MRYAHTNIAARDWKNLSDFYMNVFGCTIKPPTRKLSGDWLDQATGLSEGSRKNNFTFYAPQGHLLRGTSWIQAIFVRASTPKSSK